MGVYFTDQYSLLHFSSGVIAYFFGINIWAWFLLHLLFEMIENTTTGVKFIDEKIPFWPGGKRAPDSAINSIGDVFYGMVGFLIAKKLEERLKK